MENIKNSIKKIFQQYHIVFWYDEKQDFADLFHDIELPGIEKHHVNQNEFNIRNILMRRNPSGKYLLYFNHAKPENKNNWLLDLELANYVFHTDREAMYLQELGLDYHLKEFVNEHLEFFKSKERREKFRDLLGEGDKHNALRYKMLAVVFGVDNISIESFILKHASNFNEGKDNIEKDLERYNLHKFYWSEITRKYNYLSESPAIYDFLIEVFQNNFVLGKNTGISKESKILLSIWKDSMMFQDAFKSLSDNIAGDLEVESILDHAVLRDILSDDLFQLTDKKIISKLVQEVAQENISGERLDQIIKQRENKYWYDQFGHFYKAITFAEELISQVKRYSAFDIPTFQEGVKHYAGEFYQVDYSYRKFIWHYRKTSQNRALELLAQKVYKVYSNDWLLNGGNKWQKVIDQLELWPTNTVNSQQKFFTQQVQPFISKGNRLFIVISDAFRYECGMEFLKALQAEKRYQGSMEYLVGSLPSYTQLGMASLLPNKQLSITEGSDQILVDSLPSQGTAGRDKILKMYPDAKATAIAAEEFMKMNATKEGREFVKQHDIIYIYHNRIDKVGDDKTTEDKLVDAVKEEIDFLFEVLKKISNMNGNHMYVTSDHGFLYQYNLVDESDFVVSEVQGDVYKEARRYVIGKNLQGGYSTLKFTAEQLGLHGDVEVLIPKSINRFRIKGSGSRFIHGGASLQEIVLPLVKVSKKRADTTRIVDVDIIKSTDKITTNILAVSFLQSELVTEKILPRVMRTAIYSENDELLSDQFNYTFDIQEGSERLREVKHRFQLSSMASSKYKNQRVKLLLEEQVENSNKWKVYKEYSYTLNISFTSDFDD